MIVHEMQTSLKSVLQTKFTDNTTVSREDVAPLPPAPYFLTELTLTEFEPISTSRYAARFRFRISYAPVEGKPVAMIMDQMLETLTYLEVEGRPCRASSVAWERPTGNDGTSGEGYFRAEYVIQMTTDQEDNDMKMQTLKQGGGLK